MWEAAELRRGSDYSIFHHDFAQQNAIILTQLPWCDSARAHDGEIGTMIKGKLNFAFGFTFSSHSRPITTLFQLNREMSAWNDLYGGQASESYPKIISTKSCSFEGWRAPFRQYCTFPFEGAERLEIPILLRLVMFTALTIMAGWIPLIYGSKSGPATPSTNDLKRTSTQ